MAGILQELRRRQVFRTAGAYLVAAWLLLQVTDVLAPILDLPDWAPRLVFLLLAVGFVPALILSWAYRLSPEDAVETGGSSKPSALQLSKMPIYVAFAIVIALTVGAGLWYLGKDTRWARNTGLPLVEQYAASGKWEEAFAMATRVEAILPNDPYLEDLWPLFSWATSIPSEPEGASVFRRRYEGDENSWVFLGTTPLNEIRIPIGLSLLRLELEGYETIIRAVGGARNDFARLQVRDQPGTFFQWVDPGGFEFVTSAAMPADMVQVPGQELSVGGETVSMPAFFIDRYEVTNGEFEAFIDAGGYRNPAFWEHDIVVDGEVLSFAAAMGIFVDSSGRPGPSTWEAGTYPEGSEDQPVTGVSWFEAAAYARYSGRELPTVHHWRRAYAGGLLSWILPASNLDSQGLAAVGEYPGIGWTGTYDLVGNAREWCWNEIDGQRVILGGSWQDPAYLVQQYVSDPGSLPAIDRSAANGFRLAATPNDRQSADILRLPLPIKAVDSVDEPVSDSVFDALRSSYAYDQTPLDPQPLSQERDRYWNHEQVSILTTNGERMTVHLYLPMDGKTSYQTIVYWPTVSGFVLDSIEQVRFELDFVVRNGRAVVLPILAGMFERRSGSGVPDWSTNAGKSIAIQQVKDFRRTIDYLDTRLDIDPDKLGLYGFSYGGRMGPFALALDSRLRVGVLNQAGLQHLHHPESSVLNFLPRVTAPVLQFNGRYDTDFRFETSALPFFELLGSTEKLHVVEDTGHFVSRSTVVGETLDWLDAHLGPVLAPAESLSSADLSN